MLSTTTAPKLGGVRPLDSVAVWNLNDDDNERRLFCKLRLTIGNRL